MNIADELSRVKSEVVKSFDSVIAWAENNFSGLPSLKRPHRRLKIFLDEYQATFGTIYSIRNHAAEGGAAKRTESKSNDVDYIDAVRCYLEDRSEAFGASFFKFEKNFEHWLKIARGKKGSW